MQRTTFSVGDRVIIINNNTPGRIIDVSFCDAAFLNPPNPDLMTMKHMKHKIEYRVEFDAAFSRHPFTGVLQPFPGHVNKPVADRHGAFVMITSSIYYEHQLKIDPTYARDEKIKEILL